MSTANDIALDLIYRQWISFVPISPENYKKLVDAKMISPLASDAASAQKMMAKANPPYVKRDQVDEDEEEVVQSKTEDPDSDYYRPFYKYVHRENIELLYEREFGGAPYKDIKKSEWMPESVVEHKSDFISWINSILFNGFQNRESYKKFDLYRRQAYQWLHEKKNLGDFSDRHSRNEFLRKETMRMSENSLYAINKYDYLKEGSDESGKMPLVCAPHQEIISYLTDCGYSWFDIKGRQVGLTSVMGAWASNKIVWNKGYFIKYFAHDDNKTEEIFRDKIKGTFGEKPDWIRFTLNEKGDKESIVLNDRDNWLRLGRKSSKGGIEGHDSSIQVQAPSVYAINGGSPQVAMIDEAALIDIFSPMVKEAYPAMSRINLATGRIEQIRQVIAWTTGGIVEAASKGFEREFMGILKKWKSDPARANIIPLFFDWTCKPGMTPAEYDRQKEIYYASEGEDGEKSKIQFHQHYPTTIDDVFLTSHTTLLSIKYISDRINQCRSIDHELRPEVGRFVPIFDESKPMGENSWIPYRIVGARFVKAEHVDDPKNQCVKIFMHPEPEWANRYYAGTDPTGSVQTASDMTSSVWDEHNKTIAALVSTNFIDYRERFLQCALLSLYYSNKHSKCWELVEKNVGLSYCEFKANNGLDSNLVATTELPEIFRTQNDMYGFGIDNRRGTKNQRIIQAMYNLFKDYGDRIWIEDFWIQHKTFIKKMTKEGNETWGSINKAYYKDDALFSAAFSYICRQAFEFSHPRLMSEEADRSKNRRVVVTPFGYDKDFNLVVDG